MNFLTGSRLPNGAVQIYSTFYIGSGLISSSISRTQSPGFGFLDYSLDNFRLITVTLTSLVFNLIELFLLVSILLCLVLSLLAIWVLKILFVENLLFISSLLLVHYPHQTLSNTHNLGALFSILGTRYPFPSQYNSGISHISGLLVSSH